MGKYIIEVSTKARKELQLHHKSGKKSDIRRIEQIFLELSDTPYEGTGNPDPEFASLEGAHGKGLYSGQGVWKDISFVFTHIILYLCV